jgi:hypothetical protein
MKAKEILDKGKNGYTGYEIPQDIRNRLKATFPPKYPDFIGHHITHEFGVWENNCTIPSGKNFRIVGYADDGEGLEALVVEIDGQTRRPDGKTYHLTWSLDRSKGRKPAMSNDVISKQGWEKVTPINIMAEPKFFSR